MVTAREQNFCAGVGEARAGSCRACAHDGHEQALRPHARNIYEQTKGFVDVDFVNLMQQAICEYHSSAGV